MTIFGDNEGADAAAARSVVWTRLAIGLVQGAALYGLYLAVDAEVWPATAPGLFAALVLVFAWLPVLLLGSVGRVKLRPLLIWALTATAFLALLAWWNIASGARPEWRAGEPVPTPEVFFVSAVVLFIAHHLLVPALEAGRRIAPYPAYFDAAWKAGAQLALSGLFVFAFWILLHLGAALFDVIGLDFLRTLIRQEWFAIPVTTLAFALAVHLTDVRDGLIRGVRTVALMLLSWLLPVMTVLAAGFLAALPFTGLSPLWEAGSGTGLMLAAAAALIILVNAGYQDGEPDGRPHRLLQWAARAAGVLLVPLIGLALWGISLRIGQHGLTPDRILALACVIVGAIHAGGYAFAAVRPGPWMRPLERANLIAAVAAVAVILALFTPLADPARLSVADQMRRLEAGRVSAEDFDYGFLRFRAGGAGERALARLALSDDAEVAQRAREAQAAESSYEYGRTQPQPQSRRAVVSVHPETATSPEGLENSDVSDHCWSRRPCLAILRDLDGDGTDEVIVADGSQIFVYRADEAGDWRELGRYSTGNCGEELSRDNREVLRRGDLDFIAPRIPDMTAGGRRMPFVGADSCPELGDAADAP